MIGQVVISHIGKSCLFSFKTPVSKRSKRAPEKDELQKKKKKRDDLSNKNKVYTGRRGI